MSQRTQDPEQIIEEYTEIWNERDYSRIPDVVSESFTVTEPDAEYHGHDGLREWMDTVTSAFPDFEVEPIDVIAGEETVMAEARSTMTHEGEFEDIPPTGAEVELHHMAKFRIEDGKLAEQREYFDTRELTEQLRAADA